MLSLFSSTFVTGNDIYILTLNAEGKSIKEPNTTVIAKSSISITFMLKKKSAEGQADLILKIINVKGKTIENGSTVDMFDNQAVDKLHGLKLLIQRDATGSVDIIQTEIEKKLYVSNDFERFDGGRPNRVVCLVFQILSNVVFDIPQSKDESKYGNVLIVQNRKRKMKGQKFSTEKLPINFYCINDENKYVSFFSEELKSNFVLGKAVLSQPSYNKLNFFTKQYMEIYKFVKNEDGEGRSHLKVTLNSFVTEAAGQGNKGAK